MKSALPTKWQWPAPPSLEAALKDEDSVSPSATLGDDRDPFTGLRIYKSPHRSPARSPAFSKPASKQAARRSLNFEEESSKREDEEAAKPKKRKTAAKPKAKKEVANGDTVKDGASPKKASKKAAATKPSAAATEELEAQKKYFDDLDASVKLPEAEPDASKDVKLVLGNAKSPGRANTPASAAKSAANEDEVSPQTKDRELKRRLPAAYTDYQTYASGAPPAFHEASAQLRA